MFIGTSKCRIRAPPLHVCVIVYTRFLEYGYTVYCFILIRNIIKNMKSKQLYLHKIPYNNDSVQFYSLNKKSVN